MYDLKGKVALVTGAAGKEGLGRAIALRLAQEGANLAVNDLGGAKSRRGSLDDVVAEIDALGKGALAVYADVTKADQVERMVAETVNHFGRIDILVNNAGAPAGKDRVPVVELEESAWDLVQDVNVKGTFLCSRAVARTLISQGQGGKIINISSQAGKQGVPRYAAYCASKFAVCGFTQALAHELGSHRYQRQRHMPGFDRNRTDRRYGGSSGARWCQPRRSSTSHDRACHRRHGNGANGEDRRHREHGGLPGIRSVRVFDRVIALCNRWRVHGLKRNTAFTYLRRIEDGGTATKR